MLLCNHNDQSQHGDHGYNGNDNSPFIGDQAKLSMLDTYLPYYYYHNDNTGYTLHYYSCH